MAITRVYLLARELGVSSTAIIKKCQDEGLDVKNHMTTISAGLAATIKEWFSEGEHTTTIETTEKVNLEKVRVKKEKKAAQEEPPVAVTEEQVSVESEIEPPATAVVEPVEAPPPDVPVVETPVETAEVGEKFAGIKHPKVPKVKPKPEPKPIVPAGPMLGKPEPAKLTGPRVVRIESPEPPATLRQNKAKAKI